MSHSIPIGGHSFEFTGEKDDEYFTRLPDFATVNKSLERFTDRFLAADAICLDISANIGLTSVIMGQKCKAGRVFAFEPSPVNAKHLRDNLARAGFSHVQVVEAAVGASTGFVNFHICELGANSTVLRSSVQGRRFARVPLITIDSWISENKIRNVNFIKIDVEGYEPDVLAGAAKTITTLRPTIYMEFNSITIAFEARINPLIFAEAIWSVFDVSTITDDGIVQEVQSPRDFTFTNIMKHGCIDDILLCPRLGVAESQLVDAIPKPAPTTILS